MNNPLVSIIVPVYNAGKYVRECIESVLALSESKWELVLIDDGSVDYSADICKSYVLKDSRIHYYYQENSGVSVARNTGIQCSKGTWITFLDADDCLMPDALRMIQNTDKEIDYVILGYSRENKNQPFNSLIHYLDRKETQQSILSVRKFLKSHTEIGAINGYNNWSCWGRFFRRSIILNNNVCFPIGLRRSEDLLFCLNYSGYIRKTMVCENIAYYYRMNEESVTQKYSDYLEENTLRVMKEVKGLATDENLYPELAAFIMNNLTKCCTDYYLHPQNCLKANEKAERLEEICKNPEVRAAIKNCGYRDIALGKRNTVQNIVLLWFLKRKWYRSAIRALKILK